MICIEITESGQRHRIEQEVWVRRNRNGVIRCHRVKAQGVCDGESTWSLGGLEGYPEAKVITLAQYMEVMGMKENRAEASGEELE